MPKLPRNLLSAFAALGALHPASHAAETASPLTLYYTSPATKWTEALPIGNGRLGAMVFGGAASEHLQLNEGTLWAGGPYDPNLSLIHISEPTRLGMISYAVFCLKK